MRRDEKKRTVLFATFAVVLMMASSVAIIPVSESDATEAMHTVPAGSDYGYVLKVSSTGMTVADVEVWTGSVYESKVYSGDRPGVNSFWTFTDGLGPFNCFYAAINTTSNTTDDAKERRISNDIGKIAYVLDPYDLQKTIGGTTYTSSIYNIMLVIPTVYWYSITASNGTTTYNYTFMSNNPDFFDSSKSGHAFTDGEYISSVTSSEMVAYAHMFASSGGKDWDNSEGNTTTYPYIALGYYEAYKDTSTSLLSQTGKTPTNNTTIAAFRTAAQGNNSSVVQDPTSSYKVGIYGLWNYYGWTLYKLMSITIMDQMDSQYAIGAGKSSGSAPNATGTALNDSKQQWLVTTSTSATTDSVSLLLENAWGSLWENVDDVVVNTNNEVYTNNYLSPTALSTSAQTTTGKTVIGKTGSYSQTKITGLYTDPEVWGMPSASSGTSVTPASDGSGVNDDAWTSDAQVGCLIVGGSYADSSRGGLSAWYSYAVSSSPDRRGARLAYVMTADAAVPEYTVTVNSAEGGSASSSSSESVAGQTITITATPTSTSYRLSSLTGVYGTSSESLTFLTKTLTTSTFSMPSGDVTITPAFESVYSIAVASENASKGSVSISGAYTSTPIYVTTSATYTVVGRAMTISDTILGSTAYTCIVAIPESGFSYDVFKDQLSYEMSTGSLSSVTSITAYFIVGGSQYSVIFYESASRSTSVAVDKGYSVMLPAADEIAGKEFLGWYSDSSLTSYVGPANSYYTPTGSTLAITLYAKFVDAPDVSGVGEFRVAAFTGANTGAMVQLESASSAGLLAGTLSLGGVYYYETDGIRVYGAITYSNVKVGSTPMTSDWVTVTAGDLKDNVTFSLYHATKTLYVYYAYAQYVYSLDGTNTMTTPGVYGLII